LTWLLASAGAIRGGVAGAFWAKARADRPAIHIIKIRVFTILLWFPVSWWLKG
jgi:hypothetical protein